MGRHAPLRMHCPLPGEGIGQGRVVTLERQATRRLYMLTFFPTLFKLATVTNLQHKQCRM